MRVEKDFHAVFCMFRERRPDMKIAGSSIAMNSEHLYSESNYIILRELFRGRFPGGLLVSTARSQYHGLGSIPDWVTETLQA